jgi:Fe-S-cluster containining protein
VTEEARNPCATCGACCRSYVVPVCGYDVWRISQAQRLAPEQFVIAVAQPEPRTDGFRLEPAGPTYGLMLDKQGRLQANQSCVFLFHLAGGNDRCGIYPDRPVVCRSYPMVIAPRGVTFRDKPLCPPDSWPEAELRKRSWRHAVLRVNMQFDLYADVVARWNARVDLAHAGSGFALAEYFSYLINVYERVAALDARNGEETLARVELSWGYVPDPSRSDLRLRDLLWPSYFSRFRDIVDDFYPEIPPEPRPDFDRDRSGDLGHVAASAT